MRIYYFIFSFKQTLIIFYKLYKTSIKMYTKYLVFIYLYIFKS